MQGLEARNLGYLRLGIKMESKKEFSELDFTALQVKRQDNIKKPSILDRIFKRDSSISKENLD